MTLQQIMNNEEPFYNKKTDDQFPNLLSIQEILKNNLQDTNSKDFIQRAASILTNLDNSNGMAFYKESLSNQIRNSIQDYLKKATGSHSPVKISGDLKVSMEETNSSPINLSFKDPNETQQCQAEQPAKILTPSKSKRKSSCPMKVPIIADEALERLQASIDNQNSNHSSSTGPSSPSGDSGVLDLSRSNSVAGSAPITPKKDEEPFFANKTSSPILNQFNNPLFDYIQKHFLNNPVSNMPYILPRPNDAGPRLQPLSPMKIQKKPMSPGVRTTSRPHNPVQRRSNASRKFPCNQCRQEFTSLHSLEEHTLSVHGSYRCHICQAQFTQRSNLQRHALKHVGFKPFECTVCKKAYYRKDHLIRHMEIGHPGYDPRTNIKVHLTSSESLEFLNRAAVFANNIQSQMLPQMQTSPQQYQAMEETSCGDAQPQPNLIIDESPNSVENLSQCNEQMEASSPRSSEMNQPPSPKEIINWKSTNEQFSDKDLKV